MRNARLVSALREVPPQLSIDSKYTSCAGVADGMSDRIMRWSSPLSSSPEPLVSNDRKTFAHWSGDGVDMLAGQR